MVTDDVGYLRKRAAKEQVRPAVVSPAPGSRTRRDQSESASRGRTAPPDFITSLNPDSHTHTHTLFVM